MAAPAVTCGLAAAACGSELRLPGEVHVVTVDPELVDCVGVDPRRCMVVDGDLFYSSIEGFSHEPGYVYELRVKRYEAYPGREPPQDASRYGYRPLEVVSKTSADGD